MIPNWRKQHRETVCLAPEPHPDSGVRGERYRVKGYKNNIGSINDIGLRVHKQYRVYNRYRVKAL